MTTITRKLTIAALLMGSVLFRNSASALPINGTIGISGLNTNAAFDFTLNTVTFSGAGALGGNAYVGSLAGDYATVGGLGIFHGVQYQDFSYGPLTVTNPIWQTVNLASVGDGLASFSLSSISNVSEQTNSNGQTLGLLGIGTAYLAGFDPTVGSWSFTSSTTGDSVFTWSSTNHSPVPDNGMTAILMGFALVGIAVAARSKKSKA